MTRLGRFVSVHNPTLYPASPAIFERFLQWFAPCGLSLAIEQVQFQVILSNRERELVQILQRPARQPRWKGNLHGRFPIS
jgi:hypothetical protein